MEELSYVGKSVPRKDGVEKATGRALYTVDMVLPGMRGFLTLIPLEQRDFQA
jgi:CO/xanthine dehydrogenase Mo-binding subunit